MRAFDGQRSDNLPIKRSVPEKQKLVRELRETLASLKPQSTLRSQIISRIRELEAELKELKVAPTSRA